MADAHVVNEQDVEPTEIAPERRQGFRRRRLARPAGGESLGCSLYELDPGSRSWPFHYHTANEEAMFVLDGTGTIRLDEEDVEVQTGDYIALPVGEEGGHQVINTGSNVLRYLCLSTMVEPDVAIYPESNMVGVFAGTPPGGVEGDRTFHRYLQADADVEYWTGERRQPDER